MRDCTEDQQMRWRRATCAHCAERPPMQSMHSIALLHLISSYARRRRIGTCTKEEERKTLPPELMRATSASTIRANRVVSNLLLFSLSIDVTVVAVAVMVAVIDVVVEVDPATMTGGDVSSKSVGAKRAK